jgi:hypothetical protein
LTRDCVVSKKNFLSVHHLFIDFKAAYDTIIRNEVYVSMSELSFPTKLIRLTKATLSTVLCCVKIQNDYFEYFETRQGLRQGDEQNYKQTAVYSYSTSKHLVTPMISTLPVEAKAAVRGAFLALEREANKAGLKINESKSKYMILAGNDKTVRDVGQSVAFGDKTFEVVKEFVHLGSLVTPNNNESGEPEKTPDSK